MLKNLEKLLKEAGLSQSEFASMVGVTSATMSRYVRGQREPKGPTLLKMAKVLGVSIEELWDERKAPEAKSPKKALTIYVDSKAKLTSMCGTFVCRYADGKVNATMINEAIPPDAEGCYFPQDPDQPAVQWMTEEADG